MANSGIPVSAETKAILAKMFLLRKKKVMPACLFAIRPDKDNDKLNIIEPVEDSFREHVPKNALAVYKEKYFKKDECCYMLYYALIGVSGIQANETPILIHWCPDACKIKLKMLSASSLHSMKQAASTAEIGGVQTIHFSSLAEVNVNGLSGLKCIPTGARVTLLDGMRVKKNKTGYCPEDGEEVDDGNEAFCKGR
uniref:uncharacterized protein LOC120347216 n=1 Tax=Styela clava TaxID=7725 RepID=UPI00193996A1|nr:uncharacterized protein LOC120347216 [Styela clava]